MLRKITVILSLILMVNTTFSMNYLRRLRRNPSSRKIVKKHLPLKQKRFYISPKHKPEINIEKKGFLGDALQQFKSWWYGKKQATSKVVSVVPIINATWTVQEFERLLEAILTDDIKTIKAVVNRSNVNQGNEYGDTLLHYAALDFLLQNGASVESKNRAGETPLHRAIFFNDFDAAIKLIKADANVNVVNNRKQTPLHVAAQNGFIEIYNLLQSKGAQDTMRDSAGKTPKDYLEEKIKKDATLN